MKGLSSHPLKMLFIFLFLTLADFGFAQQPDLEFSTLEALESISGNKVNAIVQDSTGFLWIATEEGLFRFDGQTVYPYLHDEKDENSLPTNRITKLLLDARDNLWVCSNEGLCRYNPEMDNFLTIVDESETRGVEGHYITTIAEDNSGQFWLATEKMVYKYNASTNLFSKVTEVKFGTITTLIFDQNDNIWIAASTNGGLNFFDQQKQKLSTFRNDPANKQSISVNEVFDIALVKDDLWIATYGGGIDLYNLKEKTFKHYFSPENFENYATSILTDKQNKIWFCTLGALKLFDPASDNFFNYYYDANNPKSLAKNIFRIFEDKQENYWTAHTGYGVRLIRKRNRFEHFGNQAGSTWTIIEKNITCVSTDYLGRLWIGNYNNGVNVLDFKRQKAERYVYNEKDRKSLGNGTIFSVFHDSGNQTWIGSYFGGLQKFNPVKKNFETFRNNPNDTLSIACNDVRSISEDASRNLWVAVQSKGVDCFNPKTKVFRHFNAKNNHLSNDYTFQVLNDSKGNLWVATAWGLSFLPKGESIFKNFINNKTDSTSINSNDIHSVYEDGQQNIWVATPGGLNKFNPETQTFTRYSSGMRNKRVVSIISDHNNNIWIGTPTGISKFDPVSLSFTSYDQSDGLLSKEFNFRSCCKGQQNQLYFGGADGVDFFNPDSLLAEIKEPTVVLTNFKLFNKSVSYRNNSEIIKKNISFTKKIVLDYKNNSFGFVFQAINLTNPARISYAYQLDGFDHTWIYSQSKREASYTNIEPGKYTFRVKARYRNGNWSQKETTIDLIIVPVWWKSFWFRMTLLIIILTTPVVFVYWRIKRLRDQREKLEKIVAERTNEILSKNEQLKTQTETLEQKNELLKDLNSTKDKLFSIISHDLRGPFSVILGFQELLANTYFELSDEERLDMIREVNISTNQVYYLVENLLNWARIQTSSIKPRPVKFNMKEIVSEKFGLYQNIAQAKGINFELQVPEKLTAFADINLMETTLRNLVNNAVKFTPGGGTIVVKASKKQDTITISVIDSGTGMTQGQIDTLFNLEKTHSVNGTNGEKGSGLGLVLCKEFVEKNNGSITVKSQIGKGSTFSFTIPAANPAT